MSNQNEQSPESRNQALVTINKSVLVSEPKTLADFARNSDDSGQIRFNKLINDAMESIEKFKADDDFTREFMLQKKTEGDNETDEKGKPSHTQAINLLKVLNSSKKQMVDTLVTMSNQLDISSLLHELTRFQRMFETQQQKLPQLFEKHLAEAGMQPLEIIRILNAINFQECYIELMEEIIRKEK